MEVLLDAALARVAAVKPNLAFFEAFGSQGIAALERLREPDPARRARGRRREARRHRVDSRAPGGGALRPTGCRRGHRQPVPWAARRSPRCSSGPGGSPTCCAGRRTRGPASCRTSRSRPTGKRPGPKSRSTCVWPAECGCGTSVTGRRDSWWVRPPRASWPACVRVAPDLAFLVPGVGAQGGDADAALTQRARDLRRRRITCGRGPARERVARNRRCVEGRGGPRRGYRGRCRRVGAPIAGATIAPLTEDEPRSRRDHA